MVVPSFLEFKNFKAWVEVDGGQLPCYAMLVDKGERTASCWIASDESKCFSVKLSKEQEKCSIRASLFFDGKKVKRHYLKKQKVVTIKFTTIKTSKTTKRPFKFAPLEVTDDEKYLDARLLSQDNVQKIGEITVEIHRVTHLHFPEKKIKNKKKSEQDSSTSSDTEKSYPVAALEVQKVHESSRKVASVPHQIGYGEEKTIVRQDKGSGESNPEETYTSICYNDVKELIARFTFRYRPFEILKSCGIIPRSLIAVQIRVPHLVRSTQPRDIEVQPRQEQEPTLPSEPNQVLKANDGQAQPSQDGQGRQSPLPSQPGQEGSNDSQAQVQEKEAESSLSSVRQPIQDQDVRIRREDSWDDIYLREPRSMETYITEYSKDATMSSIQLDAEETKPELSSDDQDYEDENDDEIKALQARTEKLLEEKRKRREAKQGPRKRVKREQTPLVFFRPGEATEVVDLTV